MAERESSAFTLLHEKVQRWIWREGWDELKDIQEDAIRAILETANDIIIAAPTATGKTEAAFLPLVSRLVDDSAGSVRVLYVSPLKALINDQWSRLDRLCESLNIAVHKWHGDVAKNAKDRLLKSPNGILLITPESLEALFVIRGYDVRRIFSAVDTIVVDELHAFIGDVRGSQLQSLMHRLENALGREVRRIGLSATLSDMSIASGFLRWSRADRKTVIQSSEAGPGVKLQIRAYRSNPSAAEDDEEEDDTSSVPSGEIAAHLYETLRGSANLVFANARSNVEAYADRLRQICERERVPQEFWAHHGSLSRQHREDVEAMLKDKTRPTTVVCTSTLELGIDVGAVKSVAQIGCPPSVASMRQRLGRSGRRSEPAVLRIYITESNVDSRSPVQDLLRAELVQSMAMVEVMAERWYEPPDTNSLDASTLLHQVLAVLAERGGSRPDTLWKLLCETGPFHSFSKSLFVNLLRSARERELIQQEKDGTLLHAAKGERVVNHYSFYSVFLTSEEFRLVTNGRPLGTLPITFPVTEGTFLIFAGSRWRVVSVDDDRKVIELVPAAAGRVPIFNAGGAGEVHDYIRARMLHIYKSEESPAYLNSNARQLLSEARENFNNLTLDSEHVVADGKDSILFPWIGDRGMNTLVLQLQSLGVTVSNDGLTIRFFGSSPSEVLGWLQQLAAQGPASAVTLARTIRNKVVDKYDIYLSDEVLSASYASRALDTDSAWRCLSRIAGSR